MRHYDSLHPGLHWLLGRHDEQSNPFLLLRTQKPLKLLLCITIVTHRSDCMSNLGDFLLDGLQAHRMAWRAINQRLQSLFRQGSVQFAKLSIEVISTPV
jgi:hypothetical protein